MDRLNPRIALEGYSRMKGRRFATPLYNVPVLRDQIPLDHLALASPLNRRLANGVGQSRQRFMGNPTTWIGCKLIFGENSNQIAIAYSDATNDIIILITLSENICDMSNGLAPNNEMINL